MSLPRFYASEDDIQQLRLTLKQQACPLCRKTETLNLHGHLRGCSEQGGSARVARGRRLFCSNRHRRPGCGKTISLWFARVLPNFVISLCALWGFLSQVMAGHTLAGAFRRAAIPLHPTAAYRLFRRVGRAQSHLRTRLSRWMQPSEPSSATSPFIATLDHLQSAFPLARCPPAEYQLHFQRDFLAP